MTNKEYCVCIVKVGEGSNLPASIQGMYFSRKDLETDEIIFTENKAEAAFYSGRDAVKEALRDCMMIEEQNSSLTCGVMDLTVAPDVPSGMFLGYIYMR